MWPDADHADRRSHSPNYATIVKVEACMPAKKFYAQCQASATKARAVRAHRNHPPERSDIGKLSNADDWSRLLEVGTQPSIVIRGCTEQHHIHHIAWRTFVYLLHCFLYNMAGVSIRKSIRWLPDDASEPTSTIVLSSSQRRFVDIRILSSPPETSRDQNGTRKALFTLSPKPT